MSSRPPIQLAQFVPCRYHPGTFFTAESPRVTPQSRVGEQSGNGGIVIWSSELVKGKSDHRLAGNPASNQEPSMTRSTTHIITASLENIARRTDNPPEKLATTNTTPKTVMGSGIAPPRLSNDPRPNFRHESPVLNIEPAVLLGVGCSPRG